jgi:hypothetical protein
MKPLVSGLLILTAVTLLAESAYALQDDLREERPLDEFMASEAKLPSVAARDFIHRAWNAVDASIARVRSAHKQAQVSLRAADLVRDRYIAGAAIQLDLLQAERGAFSAKINQIQADADLVNDRAQLRLAAGRSLAETTEVKP